MCGRFVLGDKSWAEYHEILRGFLDTPAIISYNIKPTQDITIVGQWKEKPLACYQARWWLIPEYFQSQHPKDWKYSTFNARLETAAHQPAFRESWVHGRALIPANGFYEWIGPAKAREPWYVRLEQNRPVFLMAALMSIWQGKPTATIVTRESNESFAPIHNRMPVILNDDEIILWMNGQGDQSLGKKAKLTSYRVAPFGRDDDSEALIEPLDSLL